MLARRREKEKSVIKEHLSPANRVYMEQFLEKVAAERAQPFTEADIAHLLTELQSADAVVRAKAVRQICPCRMPWEIFNRLRKAAKRLRHDPDPTVRAHAIHVEEDAQKVASLEKEIERMREFEEESEDEHDRRKKRRTYQRR